MDAAAPDGCTPGAADAGAGCARGATPAAVAAPDDAAGGRAASIAAWEAPPVGVPGVLLTGAVAGAAAGAA
ncbi:hypothetical protein, partial [Xanthomonas citri]|uniref:hypothetical protein n=1 Tax=Xanthomonas citri TaxID=346 RepID=UPI00058B0C30